MIRLIYLPDEIAAMFGVGREFIQKYEPLSLLDIAAVNSARDAYSVEDLYEGFF